MAVESTQQLALNVEVPHFELPDLDGNTVTLTAYRGSPVVIVFACNHCPFMKHVEDELARIARDYGGRVRMIAICSNDAESYPDDDVAGLRDQVARAGWEFPYLVDESQSVARAYGAACTPDVFVTDGDLRLVYRGRIDETRPRSGSAAHGGDLRGVLDAVLEGAQPPTEQYPSVGCGIKWRQ